MTATTTQVSHKIECDDARSVAVMVETVAGAIPDVLKDFAGCHATNASTAALLRDLAALLTAAAGRCDELPEN